MYHGVAEIEHLLPKYDHLMIVCGPTARGAIGAKHNWVDWFVMLIIEAREVAKHSPIDRAVMLRLMFEMDENRQRLLARLHLRDNIRLAAARIHNRVELLFIEENQRRGVDLCGDVRCKSCQKIVKEGSEQLFEQTIVVDRHPTLTCRCGSI